MAKYIQKHKNMITPKEMKEAEKRVKIRKEWRKIYAKFHKETMKLIKEFNETGWNVKVVNNTKHGEMFDLSFIEF
jgi:hypothetical protein